MDYSIFNDQARHSIEWTIQALSDESRAFLGAVPLAIDAGDILFVHAEISEPGRFAYIDSPESAQENFANSSHFITFVGHTHHPNVYQQSDSGRVSVFPDRNQRLGRLEPFTSSTSGLSANPAIRRISEGSM